MTILETIIYHIQSTYIDVKYWVMGKLGIKTPLEIYTEDPVKWNWFIYNRLKNMTVEERENYNKKVLSQEQIEEMLKDLKTKPIKE